jgi:hypothetical protein
LSSKQPPFKKLRNYTHKQLAALILDSSSNWFKESNVLYVSPERLFAVEEAAEDYTVKIKLMQFLPQDIAIACSATGIVTLIQFDKS